MKSTMQYLMFGLALAGVPLLAEADESSARLTTSTGNLPDAMESLDDQDWQLLKIGQHRGETVLHLLSDKGQKLILPALEGKPLPASLDVSNVVQMRLEDRGWSFSHNNELLAFVPNREGRELLYRGV